MTGADTVAGAAAPAPSRLAGAFARARAEGRTALVPFLTAGYPTLDESEELFAALARGGADAIEIGVPFSDPLADGATIQRTSERAIANGVSLGDCLALAGRLRARGVTQPLVLMGYYNPILRYGVERFAAESAAAGADGFIVPDLPTEESEELLAACRANGRDLIFLLAPTSTEARIASVAERASGFIYCVSLTGVTGGRAELPDLRPYLARVRAKTDLPLAIGFGISSPEQVRQVGAVADGAIIGSALIDAIDRAPAGEAPAAAEAFMRRLAEGAVRG
ncbi:MAG: tryptophan synthase subunit alpha [Chloroflexota bacterium]